MTTFITILLIFSIFCSLLIIVLKVKIVTNLQFLENFPKVFKLVTYLIETSCVRHLLQFADKFHYIIFSINPKIMSKFIKGSEKLVWIGLGFRLALLVLPYKPFMTWVLIIIIIHGIIRLLLFLGILVRSSPLIIKLCYVEKVAKPKIKVLKRGYWLSPQNLLDIAANKWTPAIFAAMLRGDIAAATANVSGAPTTVGSTPSVKPIGANPTSAVPFVCDQDLVIS
jgi:hypothetical protein